MLCDIRRAQVNALDIAVLAVLSDEVQSLREQRVPGCFETEDRMTAAAWFESALNTPGVSAWIASYRGEDVGYVLTLTRDKADNAFQYVRRVLVIEQIAVLPEARRLGIASALLERVLASARAASTADGLGCASALDVELSSWAWNSDAHAAFHANGFTPKLVRFGRSAA